MHKEAGYFEKKKILKNANFLELTPFRWYKYETDEEGNVVILIPGFTGFFGQKDSADPSQKSLYQIKPRRSRQHNLDAGRRKDRGKR